MKNLQAIMLKLRKMVIREPELGSADLMVLWNMYRQSCADLKEGAIEHYVANDLETAFYDYLDAELGCIDLNDHHSNGVEDWRVNK